MDKYDHAKNLIANKQKGAAKQLMKKYSFNLIEFDIHSSIVADDLHQIGGVWKHILQAVEKMIKQLPDSLNIIDTITERASHLPAYPGLRNFNNGILFSSYKRPTFSEMKDNLIILLPCVYQYLSPQAVICIRKFIDFFIQCTGKEFREVDLQKIEETVEEFYYYCPVFQDRSVSKSGFNFPKLHMLSKYTSDIRQYGPLSSYSTTHSEHKHIEIAKIPARRTNHR
ncbi:hypothetical protein INT45_002982 [Circinella minor]|uniref:Uncharacterized protein n=1 Tax=Circinella minor TaxID=1195481 RepID=A0A8H7RPH3_9FUNG|nr:hypothetical protein INT45_002982 [Circinella minor]